MNFETLTTERLILRKFTPEEFKHIFENYTESEIRKLLGITSDADFIKENEKYKKGYDSYNRSLVYFQLIDKQSNHIIGGCGFHNWFPEHSRAELGYGLTIEKYKQKGLMTEAMKPIIEYGFNNMNLIRIEACVGPNNLASLKLIKKYNFTQEGYLRKHYFQNGILHDSLIFSLLKGENI